MARHALLTEDLQREYLQALRSGCNRKDAAEFVGVHPDTVYKWLKRGAELEAEDSYREFFRLVNRAERAVKIRALGIIQQAQEGDWKAAAWWLERRFPDEYGRRDRLRVDAEARVIAHVSSQEQVEDALADPRTRELLDALAIQTSRQKNGSSSNGPTADPRERVEGQPGSNGNGARGN